MTKNIFITFLICFSSFILKAQSNDSLALKKILVGDWEYIKTTDLSNNEVKYVNQDYKNPDGSEMQIIASGPEIILKGNYTYLKKFSNENSDSGVWKLISPNEIEFEMIISKDSRQGKLIIQAQKLLGKKWREDKKGNFLDSSIDKIISLTENEMKLQYRSKYILVYRKK